MNLSLCNQLVTMAAQQQKRNIVIVGGGIIGCTTAYFLTRHPKFDPAQHTITLLEASSIAAGASGKAGGLLALWAYPECLVPLSYRLHRELANEHNGAERWGYRQVGCGSIGAVVKDADLKAREGQGTSASTTSDLKEPNGTTAAAPNAHLPIQTEDEKTSKDWEKLPKQDVAATSLLSKSVLPPDLDWVDGSLVRSWDVMGRRGETETAQAHPFHFTNAMADLAAAKGVDIRLGAKVTNITSSSSSAPNGRVDTVEYQDRSDNDEIKYISEVTDVILTAGPWTGNILPRSKIEGLRAHSVVYEAEVSPYAVFTDIELPSDWTPEHRRVKGQKRKHRGHVDPEIYARPFGEVYACGEPDKTIPLPETADRVQCNEDQCNDLISYIATVSPILASAPVKAKQACYLPQHVRFGEERGPLIGQTSTPGLWIAAGHTCWGIQNGPATGLLMSELIFDGHTKSADIDKLDPKKFKV
ncbi:FAD dependent oxidoreductase [Neurospora intermedia]|uniref:FAD dependent oxidoreductase n=1 Tax=Neurospora intermedia TaxID=5142 RepID=A0ABR3D3M1_NEUIN